MNWAIDDIDWNLKRDTYFYWIEIVELLKFDLKMSV